MSRPRRLPARGQWWAGTVALAVLLAGCGGDSSAAGPGPDDPAAAERALAGAASPIAACAGLTTSPAGASPAIVGRDSGMSGALDRPATRPKMRASGGDGGGEGDGGEGARMLPDLTLGCLGDGEPVALRELRGPAVVNIWASWCGPCVDELPHLLRARDELGRQVRFLGIAISDRAGHARDWMSFNGATYPSLQDPSGSVRGPLRVPGPPVTLFLGPDGRIVEEHYGAFTSAEQIVDEVEEHLGHRT